MTDSKINPTAQAQIDAIAEKCARIKPLVVISCVTYNHEEFLRDALEGFIMQKTDFPFVAVVHDDKSTDNTVDIIEEYAEKYPDIILPIFEEENQYSKHDRSLAKIMSEARKATGAKYVAHCEGDDYWTNPEKLQKQINFLESHPDYTMCFHNAIMKYEDSDRKDQLAAHVENRDYFPLEYLTSWFVPTASSIVRSDVYESEIHKKISSSPAIYNGDEPLWYCCVSLGKTYGMSEPMSVYRIHGAGMHTTVFTKPIDKRLNYSITASAILPEPFKSWFKAKAKRELIAIPSALFKGNIKLFSSLFKLGFSFMPMRTISECILFPVKAIKNKINGTGWQDSNYNNLK